MNLNIKYKKQNFFAIISDIDIKNLSNTDFLEIKRIVETYGVAVLGSQFINDDDQIKFSERFGKLEISIGTQTKAPDYQLDNAIRPEISKISNVDLNNKMLPYDDKKVIFDRGNNTWHSDSSFKETPSKISILSAREVPEEGGGTDFIDARYALETWNKKPRKYSLNDLKNCICEHSIVYSRMNNTGDIFDDKFKQDMPYVKQKLIRIHPYTKKPAFFAGSHCSHILGWDKEESRPLIKEINDWIIEAGGIAKHEWKTGELVLWDNRRVLHRGTGYDESKYRRVMHRTTVAGDMPSYME
ncbi:MAG: TauD/TfdA family dioxygenase [Pelagibacterales bacterium]|nr:TauD/TfdA family dioxygenase [Pelagibacterales bacterium]